MQISLRISLVEYRPLLLIVETGKGLRNYGEQRFRAR